MKKLILSNIGAMLTVIVLASPFDLYWKKWTGDSLRKRIEK